MKKFVALFIVFSIICLSGNLYAKERHGAELVIQKINGQQVRGELITVKQSSLLLKESEKGADESVEVTEIKIIKIVKKSQAGKGALYGSLIGFAVGAIALYAIMAQDWETGESSERAGVAIFGGLLGGGLGALAGIVIGIPLGINKTIQFEGKSDSEIKKILEDLRKKARVPDFQ